MLDDRRLILGGIVAALVPAFGVTHVVVGQYKNQRQQLAQEWRARGERDAPSSPAVAVVDFETSLAYDDSDSTRLRLAEALTNAGRTGEARAQLLTLWADQPGNGRINLELGRLAAGDFDVSDATRYYHAAIDGAWDTDAITARRQARLELAQLLLTRKQNTAAQAELIALTADLPPEPAMLTRVGRMLLDAGADRRALDLFDRALRLDAGHGEAARLAGRVAFQSADFHSALYYFSIAAAHGGLLPADIAMRDASARAVAPPPPPSKRVRPHHHRGR